MKNKLFQIRIKDRLEVIMRASPFINACTGISLLLISAGAFFWLSSEVVLALLNR